MKLKRGYAECADNVVLTMSKADYESLLNSMRLLAGLARTSRDKTLLAETTGLADRLNDGNKQWGGV